jgi:tetratricopeptide (TPR) repeat protein
MRAGMTVWCALLMLLSAAPARAGAERLFQLAGKVLNGEGRPFRRTLPVVFLQSALTPFSVRTSANLDGSYKLKNLRPGMYSLIVAVPLVGEMNRTIEIGPSFADSKGRMTLDLRFDLKPDSTAKTISAAALSIPNSAKTEYRKAQDRLTRHDTAGAIDHLKKAVELAPQFSVALNNLGTIAYQAKQYEEAVSYFRQAHEQEPDDYAPLVNLGGALLTSGKVQESLQYNLLAVKAKPEDALARAQLGQSYFYLGQFDMAEVELKKAKALDPAHFSYPQLVLAEIYLRQQNPSSAVMELEEFLRFHPDSDRAPRLRTIIQNLRGKVNRP